MDLSTISVIAGSVSALGLLVRQIRIGLRDRADRKSLITNPSIAEPLVELRKAQSASARWSS
jgi:hypothetical protein